MKLYARLENEKGKIDGLGGNEYLDIDITVGNEVLAKLTVRQTINGWGIFDENDKAVKRLQTPRWCYEEHTRGEYGGVTGKHIHDR